MSDKGPPSKAMATSSAPVLPTPLETWEQQQRTNRPSFANGASPATNSEANNVTNNRRILPLPGAQRKVNLIYFTYVHDKKRMCICTHIAWWFHRKMDKLIRINSLFRMRSSRRAPETSGSCYSDTNRTSNNQAYPHRSPLAAPQLRDLKYWTVRPTTAAAPPMARCTLTGGKWSSILQTTITISPCPNSPPYPLSIPITVPTSSARPFSQETAFLQLDSTWSRPTWTVTLTTIVKTRTLLSMIFYGDWGSPKPEWSRSSGCWSTRGGSLYKHSSKWPKATRWQNIGTKTPSVRSVWLKRRRRP